MKPFTKIAVGVFILIALAHLCRLFFEWEVILNTTVIPQYVSIFAFVITSVLAVMLCKEAKK